jgi:hypothetical protein
MGVGTGTGLGWGRERGGDEREQRCVDARAVDAERDAAKSDNGEVEDTG